MTEAKLLKELQCTDCDTINPIGVERPIVLDEVVVTFAAGNSAKATDPATVAIYPDWVFIFQKHGEETKVQVFPRQMVYTIGTPISKAGLSIVKETPKL